MTYKEQERFAEDLLERGASLEEWLKALEDYPYSPYTWSRAAEDPRTPPEVLVRLLAHPSHLVSAKAAKTLAEYPEATDEHLAALVDEVLFRNSKLALIHRGHEYAWGPLEEGCWFPLS
ncbi:hypothetical protein TthSNM11_10700 [Thermus thermophilus]|uniref:hypothetical protein n=1 Tax=Thermus thermophilus TaxID=274 RepID=UPI001FCE0322|nr:hypothetical protein [Thermus thermophilus]BDG18867.1 hypothetical protein TthSNM11_10700 [Thermus thermophilus]